MNRFIKHILICSIFSSLCFNGLQATHIVGGELKYRCLGNDTYELILTVRRDCEFGADDAPFDDPASIGIYDVDGNLQVLLGAFGQLILPFMGADTIDSSLDNCGPIGGDVCVHESTYMGTVHIPNSMMQINSNGFVLVYQRCCRNNTLVNIVDPLETGSTFSVHLTAEASSGCNTTPVFNEWYPIYSCLNQVVIFDHAATDTDGDSLVYRLCNPKNGATFDNPFPQPPSGPPFEEVVWEQGYSVNNMMGGSIPLTINNQTGVLQGFAENLGQYLIGVCVDEYRNGVLLSSTHRDFEINVALCPTDVDASFIYEQEDCSANKVNFTNTSINANSYNWYFDFPNNIPSTTSSDPNPSFTYDIPGPHLVMMEAIDSIGGCSGFFVDTVYVTDQSFAASFESFISQCEDDFVSITLTDNTSENNNDIPVQDVSWLLEYAGVSITQSGSSFSFDLPNGVIAIVTLTVTAENGCTVELVEDINSTQFLPDPEFSVTLSSCVSDNSYNVVLSDITDHLSYIPLSWEWQIIIDGQIDNYSGETIEFQIEGDSIIILQTINYENGCSVTEELNSSVEDLIEVFQINAQLIQCLANGNYEFQFSVGQTGNVIFNESITALEWNLFVNNNLQASSLDSLFVYESDGLNSILVNVKIQTETCNFEVEQLFSPQQLVGVLDLEIDLLSCSNDGIEISLYDNSTHPPGTILTNVFWELNSIFGPSTGSGSGFVSIIPDNGILNITQTNTYDNNCQFSKEYELDIETEILNQFVKILATAVDCGEQITYEFEADNLTNSNIIAYNWTYSINGNNNSFSGQTLSLDLDNGDVLIVNLMVELDNGCTIVSDTFSDTIIFAGLVFSANPIIPCLGDTIPLISNYNPDWSYQYDPSTSLIFPNGNDSSPLVVTNEDQIYSVTVTDGLCVDIGTVEVNLDGTIQLEIKSDILDCSDPSNLSYIFYPQLSVDTSFISSYEWSYDYQGVLGSSSNYSFEIEVPEGDSILVELTVNFNTECDSVFASKVLISEIPSIEFLSDPILICPTDTVALVANPNPDWDYAWSPSAGLIFISGDLSNPLVQVDNNTTYYVTVSDGACGVEDSISILTSMEGSLAILGDTLLCDDVVELMIANADPDFLYEWSLDPTFANIIASGPDLDYTVPFAFVDITVYIRVTAPGSDCFDGLIQSIDLHYIGPRVAYINPFEICPGDTAIYEITELVAGQGLVYIWSDNPHIISDLNQSSITVVYDDNGDDFQLELTIINPAGCILSDVIQFNASTNRQLDFNPFMDDCDSFTICFEPTTPANGALNWDFGDPNTNDDFALDVFSPCYTYPGPGSYMVSLSEIASACQGIPIEKPVLVEEIISLTSSLDTIAFSGMGDIILTAETNYPSDSIYWCNANGINIGVGDTLVYTPLDTEDITAKITNSYGCSDTISIHLMRFGGFMDITIASSLDTVCSGEEFTLSLSSTMDLTNFEFEWSPSECIVDDTDPQNPIVTAQESKTFIVDITEPTMGFDTTLTLTVIVFSPEVSVIVVDGPDVFLGMSKDIEVEDPDPDFTYEWSTGQSGSSISVLPDVSGNYIVTATDQMGCIAIDSVNINVINPECDVTDVWLPNAFTPNNDGNNDVFRVRSNFIKEMDLMIFNRWGELVFSSSDQSIGWDGTFNGKELSPDAFAYSLRVVCTDDQEYLTKGNVSLIR